MQAGGPPGIAGMNDWEVALTTGTEHFGAGEIRLMVRVSGAAEVEQRRAGEHRTYAGTLDADALAAFAKSMDESGISSLSSPRTRWEMGEETLTVAVRDGATEVHRADIPANDRFSDERVARVTRAYETVVEKVTGGELPYGAAAAAR